VVEKGLRTTGLESDSARNNIHPNNKQKQGRQNVGGAGGQ